MVFRYSYTGTGGRGKATGWFSAETSAKRGGAKRRGAHAELRQGVQPPGREDTTSSWVGLLPSRLPPLVSILLNLTHRKFLQQKIRFGLQIYTSLHKVTFYTNNKPLPIPFVAELRLGGEGWWVEWGLPPRRIGVGYDACYCTIIILTYTRAKPAASHYDCDLPSLRCCSSRLASARRMKPCSVCDGIMLLLSISTQWMSKGDASWDAVTTKLIRPLSDLFDKTVINVVKNAKLTLAYIKAPRRMLYAFISHFIERRQHFLWQ